MREGRGEMDGVIPVDLFAVSSGQEHRALTDFLRDRYESGGSKVTQARSDLIVNSESLAHCVGEEFLPGEDRQHRPLLLALPYDLLRGRGPWARTLERVDQDVRVVGDHGRGCIELRNCCP